jgi:hypothetical protein
MTFDEAVQLAREINASDGPYFADRIERTRTSEGTDWAVRVLAQYAADVPASRWRDVREYAPWPELLKQGEAEDWRRDMEERRLFPRL